MIKTLSKAQKMEREKFRMPRSVQDAIPIRRIFADGIFQVGNQYSKTWSFTDINYAIASKEDKTSMFLDYSELLNALDSGASAKITIYNRRINKAAFERSVLLPDKDDGLDEYRHEFNQMLTAQVTGTSNSIVRERYLTVSVVKRKWMSNQVHHSIYHRETYSAEGVLECLSGMPFDVEFIDFDDIRSGIPKDIGVIINVGDAYTAFSGAENWIDEKVVTAIRKFVDEGGGFIGVGEPTACQHQGRYFQLSDVMGVDREMGFSLSTDKYNTCDPHHFILEDIDTAVDFGEGTSRIYAQGKHYQILAQDGEYSQLVVNEYGKGHSVYFAGLPYSPQNCRILLRAIYYAAGMPEEMKHYYVTNVDTEVTVFPETKRIAVINNSEQEQKTDLYIKGKLVEQLTLAPREMRWVEDAE